jgi:pimeloyl-ACP methyl ester carboxylesterase
MDKVMLLPGAGGSPDFWKPVGDRLPDAWPKHYFGWPGLGHQPHDPAITSIDDLVQLVVPRLDGPVDLVAQSMGGVIAAHVALAHPALVRRMVLCVTSGGVDMTSLGAGDWRPDYRKSFPNAATWITAGRASPPLPVENIKAPTLLIWGDADPISPVAVGRHLKARLPNAQLHVVPGGNHDLAQTHAADVATLIKAHLTA